MISVANVYIGLHLDFVCTPKTYAENTYCIVTFKEKTSLQVQKCGCYTLALILSTSEYMSAADTVKI